MIKKPAKKAAHAARGQHPAHAPAKAAPAFKPAEADAFQVVDQIVALREALTYIQGRPFSLAAKGPDAAGRLLDILENFNLRLAELEAAE